MSELVVGWLGVSVITSSLVASPLSLSRGLVSSPGFRSLSARAHQEAPRPLAFPPDSLPYSYDMDVVEDPVCSAGPFARHIVWVMFGVGTTESEREAAVERVEGRVVGGRPLSEQGIYHVFVEDDDAGTGVCRAKSILGALPEVEAAGANHFLELSPGFGRPLTEVPPGPVPPTPPASIPRAIRDEIYAPRNFVDLPDRSSRYPRDVVWIQFEYDASQESKQEAVDAVGGAVVGGIPFNPGGIYVVRIPHDGTAGPLAAAVVALDSLPQVRFASPDVNTHISTHEASPDDTALRPFLRSISPEPRDTTLSLRLLGPPKPGFVTFLPTETLSDRRHAIGLIRGDAVGRPTGRSRRDLHRPHPARRDACQRRTCRTIIASRGRAP